MPRPAVKHDGGSIVLWGCLAASGSAAPKKVNRIMKEEDYIQILQENIKSLARRLSLGSIVFFQWDNNPKHTSKVVNEQLNQAVIEVLDRSSQSADMNPIENMWTVLTDQVRATKPTDLFKFQLYKFSQKLVNGFQKQLIEVKMAKGTFSQVSELLYVYFRRSRYGHIFRGQLINTLYNQTFCNKEVL